MAAGNCNFALAGTVTRVLLAFACAALIVNAVGAESSESRVQSDSTNDVPLAEAIPLAKIRLEEVDDVGGFGGFSISPTPFLMLSVIFIEGGSRSLFDSFIESKKPTVQAMGLACLAQTDTNAFEIAWQKLKDNKHQVDVFTGGCLPMAITLGAVATELRTNGNFLGYYDNYSGFQEFREKVRKGTVPRDILRPPDRGK
jgi:hypothetical protein